MLLLAIIALSNAHVMYSREPVRTWPFELKSANYIIHSDFPLTDDWLMHELKAISVDVATLLEVHPPTQPIHIVLFKTQREYERYMHAYFPKLPKRRALFIQDRGPGMLFTHWHAEVAIDVRHEMTHALINSQHPLPLWLDEGIAEYFELERSSRIVAVKRSRQILADLAKGTVSTIESLSRIKELAKFDDHDYLVSWAWIHFLMHRNTETRQLLIRYLSDLRSGTPQPFSLHRGVENLFPDVREQFLHHFQSLSAPNSAPRSTRISAKVIAH